MSTEGDPENASAAQREAAAEPRQSAPAAPKPSAHQDDVASPSGQPRYGSGQQPQYGQQPPYGPQQQYAQQAPYPQPYPGPYAPPRPTNPLSIVALVLSLIGVSIGAVICGHIALGQIKRTSESGYGMAVAGLVIGYVGCAGWILFWIIWAVAFIIPLIVLGGVAATTDLPTYGYSTP